MPPDGMRRQGRRRGRGPAKKSPGPIGPGAFYNKLCVNKDTRISMPKIRIDEEMVNNILIEVLGTIAEQERETIRKRQAEGIESAKAKGKKLGRPDLLFPQTGMKSIPFGKRER